MKKSIVYAHQSEKVFTFATSKLKVATIEIRKSIYLLLLLKRKRL